MSTLVCPFIISDIPAEFASRLYDRIVQNEVINYTLDLGSTISRLCW
jgi:hypothetical protein